MLVDKTTLADLNIFHSEEEQSVFHYLNHTQTNAGRDYLRQLLLTPLKNPEDIRDTQQTIRCLMDVSDQWPQSVSNGAVMVMEKFYETPIDYFPRNPDYLKSLFFKLFYRADYSLIRFTVEHAIDFTRGLSTVVDLLKEQGLSRQLGLTVTRMEMLLNKPTLRELIRTDKKTLSPLQIMKFGGFIRFHFKAHCQELIEHFSKLDAYHSVAQTAKQAHFCFPEVILSEQPFLQSRGLFHPLLTAPVAYTIELNVAKNFLFLTGANMAGKSTFIKSVGVAVYLAHLGFPVPAESMTISLLDGLLSNIQVVDNIMKGESFFFNEVQRIRNTIEKISDRKKWLILIDELFKGTNQQDAVKCSTTVIEGLRKMHSSLFILS
ncbi:MAG TPA: hypothetical protein VG842_06005, partial [Sediminibacterium sp.]|nr:hypothetical protein [Sediminibacterium sp.]